jgi:aminodeoxyfutalosine deaminase
MILRARGVLPVSQPFIDDGAVVIAGGRLQAVGSWSSLRSFQTEKVTDLGGVLLLPGLVNAHCHLDYTDMAGQVARPKTFPDWIKELVALKATWGYSEYAASWLHGARMLIEDGVTTVADIETVPELLPDAWSATPLRVISFLEMLNVRSWHSASQIVHDAEERLLSLPGREGRVGLSPHAPYTTSPELLELAAATARRRGWPLTSHVAESREEFDMFTRGRGVLFDWLAPQRKSSVSALSSPVRFVARHKLLGPDFLAAHVNYLAAGDARLLADQGASVAHCPRSHAFFGHAPFPLLELSAAGVNLCLGTDSLASMEGRRREPPRLSLRAEMRTLAACMPELSAETIVRMATVNSARALGLDQRIGALNVGAAADLIAVPFQGGGAEAWETIITHTGPVAASMIEGRWALPPQAAA